MEVKRVYYKDFKVERETICDGEYKVTREWSQTGQIQQQFLYKGIERVECKGWINKNEWFRGCFVDDELVSYTYVDNVSNFYKHDEYESGKLHGECVGAEGKAFYIYGQKVSEEEYRKHQIIESLSGLKND